MAVALLLTQCRKPVVEYPTAGPANENMVSMTVTVGHGGKTDINGTTGAITWSAGDRLYVGDGSKYIGCLTLQSGAGSATGTFSGAVSATTSTDFGFYYLGSKDYTPILIEDASTSVEIPFATQTGLAEDLSGCHIGYGTATGRVEGTSIIINGVVLMTSKVAIAYFDFKDGTPEKYRGAITLSGEHICNSMTVGFDGSFDGTAGTAGKGISLTDNTSSQKYVMLIPTGTGEETLNFGVGATGSTTLHNGIEANKFYCFGPGEPINVNVKPIEFSVASGTGTGTTVSFSPGNLQYWGDAGEKKWRFAEHQYEYFGDNGQGSTYETVRRDLFGWGCTGNMDTRNDAHTYQTNCQPYSTSNMAVDVADPAYNINDYGYGPDYYSGSEYGLSVLYMSDWGCNTIYTHYGDATGSGWRTLTSAEWKHLISTRTVNGGTGEGKSYQRATINSDATGVYGMLLYPDGYTSQTEADSYTAEEFRTMEQAGVVFLPAAGNRNGTGLYYVGSNGNYWSSSCYSNSSRAFRMNFDSSNVNPQSNTYRYSGFAVRLVR